MTQNNTPFESASWMSDIRVRKIGNPAVRLAVAHLLDAFKIDQNTLQIDGRQSEKSFALKNSILNANRLDSAHFMSSVIESLRSIVNTSPKACSFRIKNYETEITIRF